MTEGAITLNKIAASIADPLGKSYDVMFLERIKFEILYWRSEFLRQDGERNQLSKEFQQSVVTNLQRVDKADTCYASVGCDVLRTINPIPKPIRPKDPDSLFRYVGAIDGSHSFTYTDRELLPHVTHNKFTGNIVRYEYADNYIYVFGNLKLKYVKLIGIFHDPRLVGISCDGVACYDDDSEFPISGDMLRPIIEGIRNGTLRAPKQSDQEVQIQPDEVEDAASNTLRRG